MDVADLLRYAVERGASDLHLSAGNVPFIRVDGELLPAAFPTMDATDTEEAAEFLLPPHKTSEFLRTNEADFAFTLERGAMIGFINRTRRAHVVTIKDPVEVIHTDDMSVIWQREIGPDTESYAAGLRQVLRQDPDVIFVGEIRDADSALSAIQAAQTGHLVLSTMHTIDASETVSRVVDLFPERQQEQVRTSLAGALRGVVSQRLLERI
ncbi:MAG TPA: ATPase, T2SS/T4P/T4SS family, partial [Actinomycetota bacterium]